jgi:hypothetical protein
MSMLTVSPHSSHSMLPTNENNNNVPQNNPAINSIAKADDFDEKTLSDEDSIIKQLFVKLNNHHSHDNDSVVAKGLELSKFIIKELIPLIKPSPRFCCKVF